MLLEILALPVEDKIFYAVLVFSWTVYIWEAYLAYRQVSIWLLFILVVFAENGHFIHFMFSVLICRLCEKSKLIFQNPSHFRALCKCKSNVLNYSRPWINRHIWPFTEEDLQDNNACAHWAGQDNGFRDLWKVSSLSVGQEQLWLLVWTLLRGRGHGELHVNFKKQ